MVEVNPVYSSHLNTFLSFLPKEELSLGILSLY